MSKMNEVSKEENAQAEFFRNYELARVYQDLENQKISDDYGLEITFDVNPFHKHKLLNGLDDIGLTLLKDEKISEYEKSHGII